MINENPFEGQPSAWIQWKGTEVCLSASCECGERFHIDGYFAYYVKCLACNTVYRTGEYVRLYKVGYEPKHCLTDDDQAARLAEE